MRLQHWELALDAFLHARRNVPFVWGANDCALFAADAVQTITGHDPAPAGLRAHRTSKQALRALARHGGLTGIATQALGQPRPASQACVGDVVLLAVGKRDYLAICNGATALGPSASGLVAVDMSAARMSWAVR